jgi:choline dehydrogenase-like flavoprotein
MSANEVDIRNGLSVTADFLIVGGGSAGAALAARLSERRDRVVVLVEAGMDTPPGSTPVDINDTFPSSTLNPEYFWTGLEATSVAGRPSHPYPQARVMGGGSSIMGMFALRGVPSDYARWTEAGAQGFPWSEVSKCYQRAENDLDYPSRAASVGASPICRVPHEKFPQFVRSFEQAATSLGYPFIEDINSTATDGFFSMPATCDGSVRSSSARAYLTSEVRARQNLKILANTAVKSLRIEDTRITGVHAESGDYPITLAAREVIVSAGAIYSPTILMRSGIGPADDLLRLGIRPVCDLQGVGRNLQNHSYQFFAMTVPKGQRLDPAMRRFAVAGIRASSELEGCPAGDLMLMLIGRVSSRFFGVDVAMLGSALYAPYSQGTVKLAAADADVHPHINFNLLEDPRDRTRAIAAARLSERLLRMPEVAASYRDAYLLPAGLSVGQFNRGGIAGAVMAAGAKVVINGPAALRRLAFRFAMPGAQPLIGKRGAIALTDQQLLDSVSPMGHVTGTCAMGGARDPLAVVGDDYRVHGVEGLRVVDASIMPVVPSANTHLPTLMVAEHAAAKILDAHR